MSALAPVEPIAENNPLGTLREGVRTITEENTETPATDSSEQPAAEKDTQVEVPESEAKDTSVKEETPAKEQPTETKDEDSFFDPNQVPEELKPAYKQMQSAFTKKTQELAKLRKDSEGFKEKAEAYAKYEQHIPIIEEMLKGQKAQSPEMAALEQQLKDKGYSAEAIEMMKIGADFTLKQFNQTHTRTRLQDKIAEAAKVDKRLSDPKLEYDVGGDEKATFGQIVEQFVAADPKWKDDPVAATKRAVRKLDALIGQAKTEGKEELSASAKQKAAKFPKVKSSPQTAIDTSKPMTVQDAWKQAKAELGV